MGTIDSARFAAVYRFNYSALEDELHLMKYQGVWNSNTNDPTLQSGIGERNHYYIVSVDGNTTLDGISDWVAGDFVLFNGSEWQKIDVTDLVSAVNSKTGNVVLDPDDLNDGLTAHKFASAAELSAIASNNAHRTTTSGNPHSVTKIDVSLGNVTDNAQVKKIGSSTDNAVARWDGTSGDTIQNTPNMTVADSGAITAGSDTDIYNIFGRCVVASFYTDSAAFGHIDYFATNPAL